MNNAHGGVTHVASGDLWGGAEALVFALAREQHRAQPGSVSCIVLNPGRLADELQGAGIPTTTLDESRQGLGELRGRAREHLQRFAPRIVHSHRHKENLLAWLASMGLRAPDGRAPRRVTSVHGMPEPVRGGNPVRRLIKNQLNDSTLKWGFHAIVAVSDDIAKAMRPRYPDGRVVRIHNGVTVPASTATNAVPNQGPLQLVALGRLVPIKRFDRLKELAEQLAAASLGHRITLAGDGPLEQELRASLGVTAPDAPIQMPGFVADTAALLRNAHGLVMTSDHEGIPMAVLEALSMGVPVFAFRVGGLPEIEAPGVPLHLVPAWDVAALARAIVNYFTEHVPGSRVPPPSDWSFDIRQCALAYQRLYSRL